MDNKHPPANTRRSPNVGTMFAGHAIVEKHTRPMNPVIIASNKTLKTPKLRPRLI